jgi:hypothetical protein
MDTYHMILALVVYPAAVLGAGYAAFRWLMPQSMKDAIGKGEYGQLHAAVALLSEFPPMAWLAKLWGHLMIPLRRLMIRLGLMDAAPPPIPPIPPIPPPSVAARPPAAPLPPEGMVPDLPPLEGVAIPPDHAAVHARIAQFEPGTDADLILFWQSEAAARLAEARAWQEHAETLVSGIGLDPVAAQAAAELGDVIADTAADFGMLVRRFVTVYEQVLTAVADGLILPHNAREWLTGEGI